MGDGTGDRVEAAALLAPSPRRLAHRRAGRWGSSTGMGGNSIRGEKGRFVPQKLRRKTLHYGWAPTHKVLENSNPNPIRHHP